jgi:NTP pyrophosphatase (non-canonical NTP hydrolase)
MTHLRKEVDELAEDTSDGEEMADCFILLLTLAEMAGVDLMAEAQRKMEINRKRKWGPPDADGVCFHVR